MSESDEINLKTCPFCGGEAEFSSGYYNDLSYARIDCTGCSAGVYTDSDREPDMTIDDMEESVVNEWNRRVTV